MTYKSNNIRKKLIEFTVDDKPFKSENHTYLKIKKIIEDLPDGKFISEVELAKRTGFSPQYIHNLTAWLLSDIYIVATHNRPP